MGEWIKLKASDGFELSAWRAEPKGTPRGGIVVIQEIFGVNHHIRSVTDRFAAEGYLAIAPAVFDRAEPGVELAYDPAGIARGMELAGKLKDDNALDDISTAAAAAKGAGKVGVTGFCKGGTYTWLASAKLPGLAAAVGYYGGGILGMKELRPLAPTMLHFGEKDDHIPVAGVRELEALHPDVPVYLYPAGHGFHCDERGSYDAPSAALAWSRTLEFFGKHVG